MKELFESGFSFRMFMLNMEKDIRGKFMKYYIPINIKEDYRDKILQLNKKINILAIVEDKCPDCHINLAILEKLISPCSNVELRLILRDSIGSQLDKYEANGKLKVPTFIFMDESFSEYSAFIELPERVRRSNTNTVEGSKLMMEYRAGRLIDETIDEFLKEMKKLA